MTALALRCRARPARVLSPARCRWRCRPATHRHPHRRRRRPGSQLRHQERHLPGDRARLRGPRHPARLGGPDPPPARRTSSIPHYVRRSTGRTRGPSTGPAARCSTPRARTRARWPKRRCPPLDRTEAGRADATDERSYDLTAIVLENIERLGSTTWCRSAATTRSASRGSSPTQACRSSHPQDHGQRRPGHRVLHRLLDGHHPRQGADQPPAHDARHPRAHRRVPDLRPRRRLLRAVSRPMSRRRRCVIPEAPFDLDALAESSPRTTG